MQPSHVSTARGVALVSMPWQALDAPSLQVGLLAAVLERAGIACTSHSFHLELQAFATRRAARVTAPFGTADYREVADRWAELAVGDWVFTVPSVRAPSSAKDRAYAELVTARGMSSELLSKLRALRESMPEFLAQCADEVLAAQPAVVGFTLTFTQTLASVALAHELVRRDPSIEIVFGGAACAGPMGRGLLRAFPWVDVAVQGEGEGKVVELFDALRRGKPAPSAEGVITREAGSELATSEARVALDELPTPQFDEYFARLERSGLAAAILPRLPFESSRGCWWGERAHCTFCGLNALDMRYRSKSATRALEELCELSRRHRVLDFVAVDNILDQRYYETLLPALRDSGLDLRIFYELKSNLTREQVRLLRDAGVRKIQPGLESLSTPILKLMRKGVTALQNIRVLRWCREDGIDVAWNLIFGFPGEPVAEYARMADLSRSLVHLAAPHTGPLVLDRFSPYHDRPAEFGITVLGPRNYYPLLYDADGQTLSELAYSFEHETGGPDPRGYTEELRSVLAQWRRDEPRNRHALYFRRGPGFTSIYDARTTVQAAHYVLEPFESAVFAAIDDVASVDGVRAHVARELGRAPSEADVRRALGEFVEARLAVEEHGRFLSLVPPLEARSTIRATGAES